MQRCPIRGSGKIAIEADGRIVIVLNLASMTEPNLIDDLPKMSDATQLECGGSSYAAYSWCGLRISLALRPGKTVSY